MADILLTMPPIAGGAPSVSLQEVPNTNTYQVSIELDSVTVTFQGTIDALARTFQATHDMLAAFHTPPSRLMPGNRPYQEQARANTRRWDGR